MKKFMPNMFALLASAVFVVSLAGVATAAMSSDSSAASKDIGKLSAEISMLNSDANLPQGDKIIMKQLTDNFRVGSDKVSSLLGRNMQYGDVAATLAFADRMSGGVNDANINKVVSMRDKGWDQLAKSLNVNVSDVSSKLNSIEDKAHKDIKQAFADSLSSGSAAGSMGGGGTGESMPGGATGGTGTTGQTPGGMYGTDNGSYGSGGMSGGGAGGTESGAGTGGMDSGTTGTESGAGGAGGTESGGGMTRGSSSSGSGSNY